VSWNATFCAPVAGSPESCESAFAKLLPVNPKREANAGGNAPPLLKKLLIAVATLHWLMLNPQPIALGAPAAAAAAPPALAKFAVRFKSASVAV
jgi:hypothetical protein